MGEGATIRPLNWLCLEMETKQNVPCERFSPVCLAFVFVCYFFVCLLQIFVVHQTYRVVSLKI